MRRIVAVLSCILMALPSFAGKKSSELPGQKNSVRESVLGHFKFYGFVRNYFAFDTREGVVGAGDLLYYLPKDIDVREGVDINATPSFRFLALTSRLGLNVTGYKFGNTDFSAKIETDFIYGLSSKGTAGTVFPNASSNSGTAQLRLRHAYVVFGWKDLKLNGRETASVSLKIGQAWHPMAADGPAQTSLGAGMPFNPFSRAPLINMDANLGSHWTLTATLMWQMSYTSTGPRGNSADYIKYGCTPEVYAGVTFKTKNGILMRVGATALSIRPRVLGNTPKLDAGGNPVLDASSNVVMNTVKVSDRITTISPYFYFQYTDKNHPLLIKAKTVYGSAGEHFNLLSGYGITARHEGVGEDGHYEYAPLHSSSSWISISYGRKWQAMVMGGYMRNLGSYRDFAVTDGNYSGSFYFSSKGSKNLLSVWRIAPVVCYNIGKFLAIALEYNCTSVQYGNMDSINARGLAVDGLHWVYNHRVQMMMKFTF